MTTWEVSILSNKIRHNFSWLKWSSLCDAKDLATLKLRKQRVNGMAGYLAGGIQIQYLGICHAIHSLKESIMEALEENIG